MTTALDWTPPAGMRGSAASSWRAFYRGILTEYGVTPEFYRRMYLAQSGRCYICRKAKGVHPDDPRGYGGRRLGVDHDHAIGNRIEAVRGLLCTGGDRTCNRIIGWLDAQALERALLYVTNPPARRLRVMTDENTPDIIVTGLLT